MKELLYNIGLGLKLLLTPVRNLTKPEPNSEWVHIYKLFEMKGNPFLIKKQSYITTVLDYKDGWVRYKIGSGSCGDGHLPIKDFLWCYAPAPKP